MKVKLNKIKAMKQFVLNFEPFSHNLCNKSFCFVRCSITEGRTISFHLEVPKEEKQAVLKHEVRPMQH